MKCYTSCDNASVIGVDDQIELHCCSGESGCNRKAFELMKSTTLSTTTTTPSVTSSVTSRPVTAKRLDLPTTTTTKASTFLKATQVPNNKSYEISVEPLQCFVCDDCDEPKSQLIKCKPNQRYCYVTTVEFLELFFLINFNLKFL